MDVLQSCGVLTSNTGSPSLNSFGFEGTLQQEREKERRKLAGSCWLATTISRQSLPSLSLELVPQLLYQSSNPAKVGMPGGGGSGRVTSTTRATGTSLP